MIGLLTVGLVAALAPTSPIAAAPSSSAPSATAPATLPDTTASPPVGAHDSSGETESQPPDDEAAEEPTAVSPPASVDEMIATPAVEEQDWSAGIGWDFDMSPFLQSARLGGSGFCSLARPPRFLRGRHGGLVRRGLRRGWLALGYLHYLNPLDLPDAPDRGIGRPLTTTSWCERPVYAGWFMGFIDGSPLITDWTDQKTGYLGGYRIGYDFDDYFGVEVRFAMASITISDSRRAIDAQVAQDLIDYPDLDPDDVYHRRFDHRRDNDACLWDVNLLFYPLGNAAWRPYLGLGLGATSIHFTDRLTVKREKTLFAMPLSVGLKYFHSDRVTLRMELTDNLAFSAGDIRTQNGLSLTFGMDFRFGGARKVYWPYAPGAAWWF